MGEGERALLGVYQPKSHREPDPVLRPQVRKGVIRQSESIVLPCGDATAAGKDVVPVCALIPPSNHLS